MSAARPDLSSQASAARRLGVLGLQPVEHVGADNRAESVRRLAGECQAPRRVAVSRRRFLASRHQLLQPKFPHRLQHQVARLATRTVHLPQEALLHQ